MNNEMKTIFEEMIQLMNIGDFRVELSEDNNRLNIFLGEDGLIKKNLPSIIESFNHLGQLISRKKDWPNFCIDVNNYRLERERIIADIARAAARKAMMTKENISLPIMNSYERRLVHTELAMRPDIKTESQGEGKERHIIIKPIVE